MKPGGGAALFDAIHMACTRRDLVKGEPYEPRRIIVIIGDGHDSASKKTQQEVLELAHRNLVTIYAISTMAFGFANEDKDVLEKLTTETGGHVEYPLAKDIYKDVSGYLSNPQDAGNFALTVGTGAYAAEISRAIMNSVTGISGEVTTQYVLRYRPDIDPGGQAENLPQNQSGSAHAADGKHPGQNRLLPRGSSGSPARHQPVISSSKFVRRTGQQGGPSTGLDGAWVGAGSL